MSARPFVVLLALASLAGCHRRMFENRAAQSEVIVTSTTVITNADVPVTPPAPAPTATPTASPASPPSAPSDPLPPAPSEADRTAMNLGMRDGGASTTAGGSTAAPAPATTPAAATPAPAPAMETPPGAEPPRRAPSAADRIPWAGDSNVTSPPR